MSGQALAIGTKVRLTPPLFSYPELDNAVGTVIDLNPESAYDYVVDFGEEHPRFHLLFEEVSGV